MIIMVVEIRHNNDISKNVTADTDLASSELVSASSLAKSAAMTSRNCHDNFRNNSQAQSSIWQSCVQPSLATLPQMCLEHVQNAPALAAHAIVRPETFPKAAVGAAMRVR